MKCSTVGCKREATRRMSWRDPYGMVPERVIEPVCDEDLASYRNRPALQARDEGPVVRRPARPINRDSLAAALDDALSDDSVPDYGAEARQLIGERE